VWFFFLYGGIAMKKSKAFVGLMLLLVALCFVNVLMTPELGYFVGGGASGLSTWFNLGNTVGQALATAFNNSLFHLIGIILFIL
ncbi:MAG: hypothetical protein RDV41_06425, partial [Planctomycetota bacterium]|nr:hypothetical protein [Planctomycetota bacterium]